MSGKGWFSSAISGLESRLDTILAEDDQASAKSRAADAAAKHEGTEKAMGEAKLALPAEPVSRNPSRSRPSSRLQDRLAKAVNKGTERAESRPSSDLGSRPDSPALRNPAVTAVSDMGRSSIESKRSDIDAAINVQETTISVPPSSDEIAVLTQAIQLENSRVVPPSTAEAIDTALPNATALLSSDEAAPIHPPSVQLPVARIPPAPSSRQSLDVLPSPSSVDASAPTKPANLSQREPHDIQADLTLLQTTYETALRENRDEVNAHLERIDALQLKLAYLSQQLAMSSKEAASDSDASATSRKLADKDIQIAALLEEGQKLSKNEMKQSGLLKKLRSRVQEQDKDIVTLKQSLSIVERGFAQQQDKVKHLEATEKSAQEKLKIIGQIERDIATIKAEREEAGKTITELRGKLTDAQSRRDEAEKKAQSGALEAEKRTTSSLREDLENLRIEKKLAEERAKRELQASRDENKTQQDRAKVLELELRGEITNLESNLELLRSRTEEATSSTKGDSQTTLLRQIETLQTQYSLASDNWQGIETSLTSRVAALEKERDDMAKRESDIRRKARETNSKARRLEEDLENATERVGSLEDDIKAQRVAAQKLREKLAETEKAAQDARSDSEKARGLWETELQQRIEEEKIRWKSDLQTETLNAEFNHSRPDSLSTTHRRHSPDPLGLHNKRLPRPISSASDLPLSPMDRMFDEQARRPSGSRQRTTTRVRTPDIGTSNRQDSISSSMVNVNGGGMPETPSIFTIDHDDPFDNISSPQRTINDMISVSTVGAGPSVQLVERMSAAVRRLESEKATSKEEMIRLSAQRDDAREEVVTLMREIEQTRSQAQKAGALELQLEEMNERYQTTLEMLGEKTERVEELEGDVDDLKKMYRELVQTMK